MENKSFCTLPERGFQRIHWNIRGMAILYARVACRLGDRVLCAYVEFRTWTYMTVFKTALSSLWVRLFSERDEFWWGAESTMKKMSRQIKSRSDIIPRGDRRQLHSLFLALPWKSFRTHWKINMYVTEEWVDSIATARDRSERQTHPWLDC